MTRKETHAAVLCLLICVTSTYARPPNKIIEGDHAWMGEFPHQVSLQEYGNHICGGSIIDSTHILTAAHCLVDEKLRLTRGLTVVTGTNDPFLRTFDNVFPVAKMIYHEDYDVVTNDNDIGIIKLAKPIPFDTYQRPIKLPKKDQSNLGKAMVCGWGANSWDQIKEKGGYPRILQKLETTIISNEECQRYWYSKKNPYTHINPTHICAMPTTYDSGMCFGDSGGPLTANGEVIGIASFVVPCAQGFPDVFTRVSAYLPWIAGALAQ